ncbi:NAD(P)/FAD-dependent oxidoreductase [Halovivax gelatinilyticus]|uniref:NAD(P)/FAD-dependent oxidoreductase n=1 Tax=Halovivax gelatinilyticus TaxID=2961597 RepID=UPI0020CA2EA2|nr:NAD(P)/FAD-dependent oxidoreductase [Halovivax gelatinilyticus]
MDDVCIVGGGVSGMAAGIFTARAGLSTTIISSGESILARNASLENYPGFPAGIDARTYLEMVRDQAERAGCRFSDDLIVDGAHRDESEGFVLTGNSGTYEATAVVAASWPDSEYLRELDVDREQRGSKYVVRADRAGRTGVDGLYVAGRVAGEPHQTIVAAGHGARVGLAVIQDSETAFYHDWVAPAGYFTGRDRDVPPACAEITDEQRRDRDRRARETLLAYLEAPNERRPTMHPSVDADGDQE